MRLIALLLACAALASAASTTVSGTVTDAAGNNLDGTAYISWPSFIEPDGELVVAGQLTSTITNGALSVALAPNTGSTPAGTSYAVRIVSDDRQYQGQETWVVPNTGTATLSVVRTATAPTPSATISLSSLSISGVSVGDLMTVQSGPVWARLAKGGEGQVLSIVSGAPAWAAAGGSITAREVDASPSVSSVTTLEFAQADGFVVSDQTGGVARVSLSLADGNIPNTITLDSLSQVTARDHDLLGGLTDDDHTQYGLLAGRSGGQTLIGGTGAGDDLTLETTSNATKGDYIFSNLDCSGNANGGAVTIDASGVMSCSDDDGGASAFNDLSDVTLTTPASGDVVHNNGSAWVNTAFFTAGTTDILAGRMQTNVKTALETAVAASVLNLDGGFEVASFRCTAVAGTLTCTDPTPSTGDTKFIVRAGAGQASNLFEVQSSTGTKNLIVDTVGQARSASFISGLGFAVYHSGASSVANTTSDRAMFMDVGNASGLVMRPTLSIRWGASGTGDILQATKDVGLARPAAGVVGITDGSTGSGALELAGQARHYGASATEPANCDTTSPVIGDAGAGSTYFDTGDNKLCVCVNDGTDDEWVFSDDYSHASGHCTI